jgi:beta-phosphoglucomutase-like phosphatase (HAD superfamily)
MRSSTAPRPCRIITGDDVPPGRTKPHPDVFLKALSELQLPAHRALVVEDSPHGITAAHQAGLVVVAVPNPATRLLPLQDADLIVESLAAVPLHQLLKDLNALTPSVLQRSTDAASRVG